MAVIHELSPHLADLIAAGEVVERPASVAKELIENAIDAGSTRITVEIENGGISYLRIADNGCGMSEEDAPVAFLNPALSFPDGEMMDVLDDCMSFPHLLVRLKRHRRCVVRWRDLDWAEREWALEGDLSELLQHECDHLDGVLATMRAASPRDYVMRAH